MGATFDKKDVTKHSYHGKKRILEKKNTVSPPHIKFTTNITRF